MIIIDTSTRNTINPPDPNNQHTTTLLNRFILEIVTYICLQQCWCYGSGGMRGIFSSSCKMKHTKTCLQKNHCISLRKCWFSYIFLQFLTKICAVFSFRMPLTRLETSLCSKTATGMSRSGEIEDEIKMQIQIF